MLNFPNSFDSLALLMSIASVVTSLVVVTVSNPVYAVLALIFLFFVSAFIFLLLGAEFLGFIYILIYIGAVLILFLWVVMTMPIKRNVFISFRTSFILLFTIGILLLVFLGLTIENYVLVVRITPDSCLFPAFVKYLRTHTEFYFLLKLPKNSVMYQDVLSHLPIDLTNYDLYSKLPPGNFIHDIFTIAAAQSIVHLYPIDLSSPFISELYNIYMNLQDVSDPIDRILAVTQFYAELERLSNNCEILSATNLNLLAKHGHIFFNPPVGQTHALFNLILPKSIPLDSYIFIKPSLLSEVIKNSILFDSQTAKTFDWLRVLSVQPKNGVFNIGLTLYTNYGSLLVLIGLVLLGALVGTVALIKFQSTEFKTQSSFKQLARSLKIFNSSSTTKHGDD